MKPDWPDWFVFLILCVVAFPVIHTTRPEARSDGQTKTATGVVLPASPLGEPEGSATARTSSPAPRAQQDPLALAEAGARRRVAEAEGQLTRQAKRVEAKVKKTVAKASAEVKQALTYEVVAVVDGDTIRVAGGRTVRLLQIDTPEISGKAECFGADAAEATRRLLLGKRVSLARDPHLDSKDRYGRLLRYVYLDGQNVSLRLVSEGVAAPYFYRGEHGLFAWDLDRRARQAKAAQRGLWGACPSTPYTPSRGVATGPVYSAS